MRPSLLNVVLALVLTSSCAGAQPGGNALPASTSTTWIVPGDGSRLVAVISDHHAGIGRRPDGRWHETEDFRWETELEAFLDALAVRGGERVDLIIAGDLLELWQPPADIRCDGASADLGCTVPQMRAITERVLAAHPRLTQALRRFAERGENRLHIIPGNHDSALLLAAVWQPLAQALDVGRGRVNLVANGVWSSRDGSVVVEHGHQIGADVNRYEDWPGITRSATAGTYLVRPWGERFVQKLFNEQEAGYPIIDNLSPEAAGARYHMAERGLWGSAADMARFLVFNLTETSPAQKASFVGGETAAGQEPDEARGRAQGHRLFAAALAEDDPYGRAMLADTPEGAALRAELDALARDGERLSPAELLLLCDQAALRGKPLCIEPTAGYMAQKLLVPRERVLRQHLAQRLEQYPRMRVFVYGHTHELEKRWPVQVNSMISVDVLNSGAFQRVVGEKGYLERVNKKGVTPAQGLRLLDLDDLPPCYSAVLMPEASGGATPETLRWHMPPGTAGAFVPVGDPRCD